MEMRPANSCWSSVLTAFLILESVFFFFFTKLLKLSKRNLQFYSPTIQIDQASLTGHQKKAKRTEQEIIISREEAEAVMEAMGLMTGAARECGEKLKEFMGQEELASMFEEMEPSLEELKEVFCVFDEDGDGFVEARELQSVLCKLGIGAGMGLDLCAAMVGANDEDGDGKINFRDFVKLMERSFS